MTQGWIRQFRAPALLLLSVAALLVFSVRGVAQATAAAVGPAPYQGFQPPTVGGTLSYAGSVSESLILGFNGSGGATMSTNFSGDLGFLSRSETHPFSALYSGGYLASTGGQPNGVFQNLALSQVIRAGRTNFVFADNVSYLPQTPINGFSGIPGIGDLGIIPVQTGGFGQGILTLNDAQVSNQVSGTVSRNLTAATAINVTGSDSIQRFLGSSNTSATGFGNSGFGIDNNQVTGTIGLNHRIDARNSLGGSYTYSTFTYATATPFSFITQSASLEYMRRVNRKLTVDVSAGPQRTSSSNSLLSAPSLNVSANADVNYVGEKTLSSLNYTRGVNNGSGLIEGARSDSVSFRANRSFGRPLSAAVSAGYTHAASLPNLTIPAFSTNTLSAGVQASRGLRRNLFGFVSYTLERQSSTGFAQSSDLFNGISHIFGVGITYSPSPIQLGRR